MRKQKKLDMGFVRVVLLSGNKWIMRSDIALRVLLMQVIGVE